MPRICALRVVRLLAPLLLAALDGPACSDPGGPCVPEPSTARVLFSPLPEELSPFPDDRYTRADPITCSGRRLELPALGPLLLAPGLPVLDDPAEMVGELNELDGFSVRAPLLVPLSEPLDPASLPERDAQPTAADGARLVCLEPVCADDPLVPLVAEAVSFLDERSRPEHRLVITPRVPLRGGARYALVLTGALRAEGGAPLGPAADFAYVCGRCPLPVDHPRRAELEALRTERAALLAELELEPAEVAFTASFTTGSVLESLCALGACDTEVSGAPDPALTLDADGDGAPDVVEPESLDDRPDPIPLREHIGVLLRGTFTVPEFRAQGGALPTCAVGLAQPDAPEPLPFLLALPASGGGPFPVVLVLHGHGGSKNRLLYLAGFLAERGLASLAIDLPEHGEAPSRGAGFFDISQPRTMGAVFLQAAVNAVRLLRQTGAAGLAALDLAPAPDGDGVPDLDPTRLGLVGESAGAMTGAIVAAVSDLQAVVLNVGGGGFSTFLELYLTGLYEERQMVPLQVALQALLDRGDPANFAAVLARYRPGGAGEIAVLLQEAVGDEVVPNAATEELARAYGCPLVRPFEHPVSELSEVDAPHAGSGLFEFHPAEHGFMMANSAYPESSEAARWQMADFLYSALLGGGAVVRDPAARTP